MKEELYKTLGRAKCEELDSYNENLWRLLCLSGARKSAQVRGVVMEGVARDFIRDFLPAGFGIKSGLIFDTEAKKMSPQIDGIIYSGVPLSEFTDAVVVEKEQVKAVVEIRSYISTTDIFGEKSADLRDESTGLAKSFEQRKNFLPPGAKYILFAFEAWSSYSDDEVRQRLKQICDANAIVSRKEPRSEREKGKWEYNFDNSVSRLIEWLRNLSYLREV